MHSINERADKLYLMQPNVHSIRKASVESLFHIVTIQRSQSMYLSLASAHRCPRHICITNTFVAVLNRAMDCYPGKQVRLLGS